MRRVRVTIVAVKRSIMYCECVNVILVILHSKRVHHIVLWYGLSDSTIVFHISHKRHAVRKKTLFNIKCMFDFL
jgi:hypothetical protein